MWYLLHILLIPCVSSSFDGSADMAAMGGKKKVEDTLPVIEIRGEGKPMTSAQIRQLEEMGNGGKPMDIKVERTFIPANCPHPAERKDFVTFHYKIFLENGRKVHQTYGGDPVRIQMGVGMALPGLDKALQGMCVEELRTVQIPYRLAQRSKSKVWKHIPTDEHWISLSLDLKEIEEYSHERQFRFMDMDNDAAITEKDLINWSGKMREFGKNWRNEDMDNVVAAKYYIKYFDANGDGQIDVDEFTHVMERDEATMERAREREKKEGGRRREKGRLRDPGFAWILDFDNDGVVSYKENDAAADLLEKGPQLLPTIKDEL